MSDTNQKEILIKDLRLPAPVENILKDAGIRTVEAFEAKDADRTILNISDLSPFTLSNIRTAIKAYRNAHPDDGKFAIVGDFLNVKENTWLRISILAAAICKDIYTKNSGSIKPFPESLFF